MTTLQRSLSLLRRMHGTPKLIALRSPSHHRLIKPQYIAIRGYFNPDGDYQELSETAWKEKRMYRYYKFSNDLTVKEQQRGYAAGIYVIAALFVTYFFFGWIDVETSMLYRRYRTWRKEVRAPWFQYALDAGYYNQYNYVKDLREEMYDKDLPELKAKGHDAPNRREWKKQMCLDQVMKRDKEFDSPFLFETIEHDLPPMAYKRYRDFYEEGKEKEVEVAED